MAESTTNNGTQQQRQQKPNRGALWKNAAKQPGDKQPDYKGTLYAGDVGYWVSAWIETAHDGKKYMSLSLSLMYKQSLSPAAAKKGSEIKGAADDGSGIAEDLPY